MMGCSMPSNSVIRVFIVFLVESHGRQNIGILYVDS
jgi:hypothetical protein